MDSRTISVESKYGAESREPMVVFRWGAEAGELSPEEARAHALVILEAADAAESDAFVVEFFAAKGRLPLVEAARVLKDFREWRTERHSRAR